MSLPDDVLLKIFEDVGVEDISSFNLVCKQFYHSCEVRSIWVDKYDKASLSRAYGPASLYSTPWLRRYLTRLSKLDHSFENPQIKSGDGPVVPVVPYKTHSRHSFGINEFGVGSSFAVQGDLFIFLRHDFWLFCYDIDNDFREVWRGQVPLRVDGTTGLRRSAKLYCNEITESGSPGVGKMYVLVWLSTDQLLFVHDFQVDFPSQGDKGIRLNLIHVQPRDLEKIGESIGALCSMCGPWFIRQLTHDAHLFHIPDWQRYDLVPPVSPAGAPRIQRTTFAGNGRVISITAPTSPATNNTGPGSILTIYNLPSTIRCSSSDRSPTSPVQRIPYTYHIEMKGAFNHVRYIGTSTNQIMHVLATSMGNSAILSIPMDPNQSETTEHAARDLTTETLYEPFVRPKEMPILNLEAAFRPLSTRILVTLGHRMGAPGELTSPRMVQVPLLDRTNQAYKFGTPTWLHAPDVVLEVIRNALVRAHFDEFRGRVLVFSFGDTVALGGHFTSTLRVDCVNF